MRFFFKSFSRIYLLVFFGNLFLHQLYPRLVRMNKPPFLSGNSLDSATLDCMACSFPGAASWTPKTNPPFELANRERLCAWAPVKRDRSHATEIIKPSRPPAHVQVLPDQVCAPFCAEVKVFALLPGSWVCFVFYQDPQFGGLPYSWLFCKQRDDLHPWKQVLLHSSWGQKHSVFVPSKFCKTPASLFCSRL